MLANQKQETQCRKRVAWIAVRGFLLKGVIIFFSIKDFFLKKPWKGKPQYKPLTKYSKYHEQNPRNIMWRIVKNDFSKYVIFDRELNCFKEFFFHKTFIIHIYMIYLHLHCFLICIISWSHYVKKYTNNLCLSILFY